VAKCSVLSYCIRRGNIYNLGTILRAHCTSIAAAVHSLTSTPHQNASSAICCGCSWLYAAQFCQQLPLTMPLLLLVQALLLLRLLSAAVLNRTIATATTATAACCSWFYVKWTMVILLLTLITAFITPVDVAWYSSKVEAAIYDRSSAFIEILNLMISAFFAVDIVVSCSLTASVSHCVCISVCI
jgi:hypothetical protein